MIFKCVSFPSHLRRKPCSVYGYQTFQETEGCLWAIIKFSTWTIIKGLNFFKCVKGWDRETELQQSEAVVLSRQDLIACLLTISLLRLSLWQPCLGCSLPVSSCFLDWPSSHFLQLLKFCLRCTKFKFNLSV